jgi:glutathione peroxidase-family protein
VLVGRNGQPYRRYATAVDPSQLVNDIKYLLSQPVPKA